MPFRPLHNAVTVRRSAEEERIGLIYLPETHTPLSYIHRGVVVSTGEGRERWVRSSERKLLKRPGLDGAERGRCFHRSLAEASDRTHACDLPVSHGLPRRDDRPPRRLVARDPAPARAVPWAPRMHAVFFGLKRAWHGTLRVTRRALAALGLTAARFDLLYALDQLAPYAYDQRKLRKTLGVNRTTISRMLGSLENLGLVTRGPCLGDRRTRSVKLTDQGRRRLRVAVRRLVRSGAAQLALDSAIAGLPNSASPGSRWNDDFACLVACDVLESFLSALRHAFGDLASLHYSWHPDD